MAYDEDLADRLRGALSDLDDVDGFTERAMFGGLAFMVGGHMAVCDSGQGGLMVRVDPTQTEALLAEPGVEPMEMKGRELAGWVRVDTDAVTTDEQLERWVRVGVAYVGSLPAK